MEVERNRLTHSEIFASVSASSNCARRSKNEWRREVDVGEIPKCRGGQGDDVGVMRNLNLNVKDHNLEPLEIEMC